MRGLFLIPLTLLSCGKSTTDTAEPATTEPTDDTATLPTGDSAPPDETADTAPPDETGDTAPTGETGETGETGDTDPPTPSGRSIVLMIGDGMGPGQLEAASLYAHGETGRLFLQSLDHHATVRTGSLSGITDSAAAATGMATGHKVLNTRIGVDRDDLPAETLVELAKSMGMATAVVSTAAVAHATPAAFTAHNTNRNDYTGIAESQVMDVRPDVLLGGGAQYYLSAKEEGSVRSDEGLIAPLEAMGCPVVRTADELAAADRGAGACLYGLFANNHLSYVAQREKDSTEPTLAEMSLAAWEVVSQDPDGFVLVIEGARIDMASHSRLLEEAILENLAFDETIEAIAGQIGERDDVTLIVTADHECGGLNVLSSAGAGVLPEVTWRWNEHTNADIDLHASGPLADTLAGRELTHPDVYATARAVLTGEDVVAPPSVLTPDGDTADQRWRVAAQALTTNFGAGYNQLDALTLDADAYGLAVGIEGVFEWDRNAVVLLLDADYGAGTGYATLSGTLSDEDGLADIVLSALPLEAPGLDGFGADLAFVGHGGSDLWLDELYDYGGLRGITADYGAAVDDLPWLPAAAVFGQDVRTRGVAIAPVAGEGLELFLSWADVYPTLGGGVPAGATVAVAVLLVNDSGELLSNQALPPYAADPDGAAALPGVVAFTVDSDGDGVGDGASEPVTPK